MEMGIGKGVDREDARGGKIWAGVGGGGGPHQLEERIFQLWFGILVQTENKAGE